MRYPFHFFVRLLFVFALLSSCAMAQVDPLRVGYIEARPFTWIEEGELHGITQSIWQQVAMQSGIATQYINLGVSPNAGLQALERGEVDVLIAPLAVTYKRLQKVDFSRPYFINQVGVVLKNKPMNPVFFLARLLDRLLVKELLITLGLFLLFVHIYWLIRRRVSSELHERYWPGITNALWFSFSHLISKSELYNPRHWIDKGFMFLWLTFALVFVSTVFGIITSSLTMTLSEMDRVQHLQKGDLENMTVGVLEGSQNYHVSKKYVHKVVREQTYEALFKDLQDETIQAIIMDQVIAQEYLRSHPQTKAIIAALHLDSQEFAFALQKNSPYLQDIDLQITRLQDSGQIEAICRTQVGPFAHACQL